MYEYTVLIYSIKITQILPERDQTSTEQFQRRVFYVCVLEKKPTRVTAKQRQHKQLVATWYQ